MFHSTVFKESFDKNLINFCKINQDLFYLIEFVFRFKMRDASTHVTHSHTGRDSRITPRNCKWIKKRRGNFSILLILKTALILKTTNAYPHYTKGCSPRENRIAVCCSVKRERENFSILLILKTKKFQVD